MTLILFFLLSTTFHTIQIDGNLNNFNADELVYKDAPDDSYWQGNEIYGIYCTWDRSNIYLGLSYRVQNNAVLLVMDAGRQKGVNDINNLDWYPRNFQFYGMNADIIFALWNGDLSTGGIREIIAKDKTSPIKGAEVYNNGSSGDSSGVIIRIPFSSLYGDSSYVPSNLNIKLVALIAAGDHTSGGDAAPNNENIGASSAIRTYIDIPMDTNGDSIVDNNVCPSCVTRIDTYPKINLKVADFNLSQNKVERNGSTTISFKVTDYTFAKLYIFNRQGVNIYEKHFENCVPSVSYTGVFTNNGTFPQGIYFVVLDVGDIIRIKKPLVLVQ